MVFNFPELCLDLALPTNKSSIPIIDFNDHDDLIKLNEFVNGLDDEFKKIQPFQRELPLSFSLLNYAIGKLKEKAKKIDVRRSHDSKICEIGGVKLGNDVEKKDWMSSVQLWCPRNEEEESRRKPGVGLVSLSNEDYNDPGLSLMTPAVEEPECRVIRPVGVSPGSVYQTGKPQARPACHSAARKQRRCWSPELHQRFIDALEKLGGSKVATPKQIRDQMQVQGLTNDEVKSHLQKYRLHIKKASAASTKAQSSVDHTMSGNSFELGYSNSDLQHSRSPESPLDFGESRKHNSSSMEENDEM